MPSRGMPADGGFSDVDAKHQQFDNSPWIRDAPTADSRGSSGGSARQAGPRSVAGRRHGETGSASRRGIRVDASESRSPVRR